MKPTSMCPLTMLVTVALLLACETESGELPSAPDVRITAHQVRSHAAQFSDWSAPVNLGSIVNSPSEDLEVSISKNGLSLYIASSRSGNFDIWVSRRASVRHLWGTPQSLGSMINTSAREQGPYLTPDGHGLYFFSDRPGGLGGTDLYVSRRRDKRDDFGWQAPVNLGSEVNTSFNENLPVAFEDDNTETTTLYFNSNRPGGLGGTDVYASGIQRDGTFGPAVLVGELSSPSSDAPSAIRRDGLEMVLGSTRPGGPGDPSFFDLWVATRASPTDSWSTPVNLGAIVNMPPPVGDSRAALSFDATTLYIISDRLGGVGRSDIWVSTRTKLRHDGHDDDDEDDDDRDRRRPRRHRR